MGDVPTRRRGDRGEPQAGGAGRSRTLILLPLILAASLALAFVAVAPAADAQPCRPSASGAMVGAALSRGAALDGAPPALRRAIDRTLAVSLAGRPAGPQELTASDAANGDVFGFSLALSGGTALVGAPYAQDSTGAVYVFTKSAGVWSQAQKLTASDGEANDAFGFSVALSGSTALVGRLRPDVGAGAVYVFTKSAGTWTQTQELTPSNNDDGPDFGISVALSGSTAFVGAVAAAGGDGAVFVYSESDGSWSQTQELVASDGAQDDFFGYALALSGGSALVGAIQHGAGGAVYVFTRSDGTWSQNQELADPDPTSDDDFGFAIALSGDSAVIGAPDATNGVGAAFVFTDSADTWSPAQELTASDGQSSDEFGLSVALSGNIALIGAPERSETNGAVYVFTAAGGAFAQAQEITVPDGQSGTAFGRSVAAAGSVLLVGAPGDNDGTGAVWALRQLVTSVSFGGTVDHPTVTITGTGFGKAPTGYNDNKTSCGTFKNNGKLYGPDNLWFNEDSGRFIAGQGTPPSGSCVGLLVASWSKTRIVYHFGSAYEQVDNAQLVPGQPFTVSILGDQFSGTITFGTDIVRRQ